MKTPKTLEQQARDLLERMEAPDAQSYSAGELVELAELISLQAQRQPLTDGMIGEMSYYCGDVRGVRIDQFKFARAIEEAHGITPPQGKI